MPGLRRQPSIEAFTHSLYHADLHSAPPREREQYPVVSRPRYALLAPASRQLLPRPPQWLKQKHNYLGAKPVSTAPVYGSNESDDLQAMVHDFIENDTMEHTDGSDLDAPPPSKKLIDTLQTLTAPSTAAERELLTEVKVLLLSTKEDSDLICEAEGSDCKGGCVKRFVVHHLNVAGYDAGVCKSKWLNSGRVPGGEYEYVDVVVRPSERVIVDMDFQAQFEIARPTEQYEAALRTLPAVFVGSAGKLQQTLQVMSEAAKVSLKQSDMHLPPWRTLDYMSAKWLSPFERRRSLTVPASPAKRPRSYQRLHQPQCRHSKVSLVAQAKTSDAVSFLGLGRHPLPL